MYHKHHTRGVVLASLLESVDNRRVLLLTPDLGLVSAQVKSARVAASKLKAGIQEYSFGEYSLLHGKMGWLLVSDRAQGNVFELNKNSKRKISIISRVLNLVRIAVAGEESNPKIFEIIDSFLEYIKDAEEAEEEIVEVATVARLLCTLGFLRHDPTLDEAMACSTISKAEIVLFQKSKLDLVVRINEALAAAEINS